MAVRVVILVAPLIVRATVAPPSSRARDRAPSRHPPSSRFRLPTDTDLDRCPLGERHVLVPAIYFLEDDLGLPMPADVLECEAISYPRAPADSGDLRRGWPFDPVVIDYDRLVLNGVNSPLPDGSSRQDGGGSQSKKTQILLAHQQHVRDGYGRLNSRRLQQERQPNDLVLMERSLFTDRFDSQVMSTAAAAF